jgi:hypothetical protein
MKWAVSVRYDASTTIVVEASSAEDAKEKAMQSAYVSLCHQCAKELDLGDPVEATDAWEA